MYNLIILCNDMLNPTLYPLLIMQMLQLHAKFQSVALNWNNAFLQYKCSSGAHTDINTKYIFFFCF